MRAMWSGSISFGLVNIPVKLFSGTENRNLDLDMLRKSDLCSIKYLKVCRNDNKEVPNEEIVKGYQYGDGRYIVLTGQDFENASPEKSHLIEITDFVQEDEIDSRYFDKPYYLEPDKGGGKAYVLLREALQRSGRVGIASYVLRNRGNIAVVKAHEEVLVLNAIRYHDEIRSYGELKIPKGEKLRNQEIQLALSLIDQLTVPFDPAKYHDTYREDLQRLVEEKAKGIEVQPRPVEAQPSNVIDIMSLLKDSLKATKKAA